MLKVIFKVQKLVLKLKNTECQIIAKKDQHAIPLSPLLTISNGQACIDVETQFLIIQNDPLFMIQVTLNSQGGKRLGGELLMNVAEWDQNVYHSTIATLKKSPDRNSQICYTFLYIRKDFVVAQKSLILCSQYRDKNLTEMEGRKRELTNKQNKLEDQIKKLKQENQILETIEKKRKEEINKKKNEIDQKIKINQQSIDLNNYKNDCLKRRNDQIVKMIQKYGKAEIKEELQKKYPQRKDQSRFQTNNMRNRMIDEKSQKSENGQIMIENQKTKATEVTEISNNKSDRQRSRQKIRIRSVKNDN